MKTEHDGWTGTLLMTLAMGALGRALQVSNGTLWADSIEWLLATVLLAVGALVLPRSAVLERHGERIAICALLAVIALQFGQLFTAPPGIYLRGAKANTVELFMLLGAAAAVAGSLASSRSVLGRLAVPLLLGLYVLCGLWLLRASPAPHIDVFVFQRDASAALLSGQNPYAMTFPDIYGNSSPFYGEGLSVDGRLQFGFPYPPLSLLMVLPGHLLGDFRYAHLAAIVIAAALMAYAVPGRLGPLAAAVFLSTPRTFFVLEQGWTEPLAVLLLSLLLFSAARRPRWIPYVFGLLVAVKQYFVFAAPLLWLLAPGRDVRFLWGWAWRSAATALAVSLPLVLWNPAAFFHSVVTLQVHQPFRADALSFLAWFYKQSGQKLSTMFAFAAMLLGILLGLWRAPRTPAGLACAISVTFLLFFAFNKQAFANYYFFIVGAFCCAVASSAPPAGGWERESRPRTC